MTKVKVALLLFIFMPHWVLAEPVRVGVLTDLSGPMAFWGTKTRIGAEIAAEEIKQNGGEIELIFGDHQLQAKNAVSEFQKLVTIDNIQALYSEFTPTTVAIAPIVGTKNVPTIYSAAAASPLSTSSHIFKSYLDYVEGCHQIGEYWKSKGIKTVGFLKATLEFADLCAEGLSRAYPNFTVVMYNPGDDVATQVLSLKRKGVEAVMNVSFEPDLLRMIKSIQNLNWNPLLGAQDDALGEQALTLFPELLAGMTVFSLPALGDEFVAKIKAKDSDYTEAALAAAGLAYLHIKQLYSGVLQCARGDTSCVASKIRTAPPDKTTGFNRFSDRIASFKISLNGWANGTGVELKH